MKNKMKMSIVLPAYNEKGNAEELAKRLKAEMKKLGIDFEIVFIIQGTDGTFESLRNLRKQIPEMRLYHYPEPLGAGGAFREGFAKIKMTGHNMTAGMITAKRQFGGGNTYSNTYVLTMDADLNHHPEELPRFLDALEKTNADIIIGSRKIAGGKMDLPAWKKFASDFTNFLLPRVFGLKVKDITSGYRLFKIDVVKKIRNEITSRNFEVYSEILIRARRHGFTMAEVPITYTRRTIGKSKFNLVRSAWGYFKLLFA